MIITISILERLNQKFVLQKTDQLKITIAFMKVNRNFKEKERFTDALQGRLHPENNPGFRENLKCNDQNERGSNIGSNICKTVILAFIAFRINYLGVSC